MKLIVGAGDRRLDGYKHHDIRPLDGLDYCCDFYDLGERIPLGTVEEIQMTHVLEHFPMGETQRVLRTLHGLLAEGGKLYLEVPNLFWHCEEILLNPTNRQMVEYMYGGQLNPYDYHYTGFTPELLNEELVLAGFTLIEMKPNSSIEVCVEKL
jgi:predicted SAM-dependent methyltransferase